MGGLVETGLIDQMAKWAMEVTAGNFKLTGMLILWLSAIASTFVDNIPFVAGLAEKNGYKMSFLGFMKLAFPLMLVSIGIATVYLLVFYF